MDRVCIIGTERVYLRRHIHVVCIDDLLHVSGFTMYELLSACLSKVCVCVCVSVSVSGYGVGV